MKAPCSSDRSAPRPTTWLRPPSRRLICHAARCAPGPLASRLEEEWLADLRERGNELARLRFAFGCLLAALSISRTYVPPCPARPEACPRVLSLAPAYHRSTPSAFGTTGQPHPFCEINTTPLIDVMLVMLVTLIVSLPLMTHAVKIQLPQAPPVSHAPPPEVVDLDIDADGSVAWNGTVVAGSEALESLFRGAAQRTPQPELHLRADRRAKYGSVAAVLASAQRSRIEKIGFADTAQFRD